MPTSAVNADVHGIRCATTASAAASGSSGVTNAQDGSSANVRLNARPAEVHAVPASVVEAELPDNLYAPMMTLLAAAGAARQRGHISSWQQDAIFEAVLSALKEVLQVAVRRAARDMAVTPAVPVVPAVPSGS